MFDYIENMKMSLTEDRVIRIILTRNDWEVTIRPTDEIWNDCDGKLLVIEHESGSRALVNLDQVCMVCTMNKGVLL